MPSITFVLPHWLYWCGLLLFPLLIMYLLRRGRVETQQSHAASLPIAWFLLVTAGFIGMHRLYLRNSWGLLYVPVFLALLVMNATARDSRDAISSARNEIVKAEFMIEVAEKKSKAGAQGAAELVEQRRTELETAKADMAAAQGNQVLWTRLVQAAALLILLGLIWDAFRLRRLKARCDEQDAADPIHQYDFSCATVTADGGTVLHEDTAFARFTGRLNTFAGTFVAYWSVIAVIVYYFEVLARYVFNSPTNWAHESMFLMFGAQYPDRRRFLSAGKCPRPGRRVLHPPVGQQESPGRRDHIGLFLHLCDHPDVHGLDLLQGFLCRSGGLLYRVGHPSTIPSSSPSFSGRCSCCYREYRTC